MTVNFKRWSFWFINLGWMAVMLLIISLILLASQTNPLTFLEVIFVEPWENLSYFSGFLNIFTILLLVALAAAITFKYRIYNFGIAGQMLFSIMITYVIGLAIFDAGGTNRGIVVFLLLITSLVGAFTGFLIAVLKNYFRINEIISTILFNFIAWQGYKGVLDSPIYKNRVISEIFSLKFSVVSSPFYNSNLFSAGIIIVVIVVVVVILLFNNRVLGFKLNASNKNPIATKQARIDLNHQILKVLPISGAIAGLAGYFYFLSTNNHLPKLDNIPQEGFYAIVIGALVFFEPYLTGMSTFVFTLFIRPIKLDSFAYLKNSTLATVILGVAVYLMALFPIVCYLWEQSPYIQEQWFKIKRKLFHIAAPVEEVIPGLEKSTKSEVEVIKLNLVKKRKHRFKVWKSKHKVKSNKKIKKEQK